MRFLDTIFRNSLWNGVTKELINSTNYIRNEIMPKVKIILNAYIVFFGYEIKSMKTNINPGKINLLVKGNLGEEMDELTSLLTIMYPEYIIYQDSGSNSKQRRCAYELIISHPNGYSFIDDFIYGE